MKLRKASLIILTLLLSLPLMTSCASLTENNTIEEIAPVTFLSLSEGSEGKIKISTLAPPLTHDSKKLVTKEVHMLEEGRKYLSLNYFREYKLGQLRMLFISESLARKGIASIVTSLLLDPETTQRLYLVVVDGNFDEYIMTNTEKQKDLEYFLYRMFKHYENKQQGTMTVINLHRFLQKYHNPLSDPVLPVFEATPDDFKYEGTGLFQKDKMAGKLSLRQDHIFQLLDNVNYIKLLPLPEFSILLGQVRSKVDLHWNRGDSIYAVNVNLYARLVEYQGDRYLGDTNNLMELQSEIENFLKERTTELLQKMQKWDVDPLSMGYVALHPFSKPISGEEWQKTKRSLNYQVKVHLTLNPLPAIPSYQYHR
ncbi:Ger(x)C family spore germination C-terminal domain-containing protein [Paenibacillus polymyxa]|uniref:Spore gernimation protein n=1 Tax=Paenibacillus polymyxa (strain SC2) TaxID=886882 RepID=E3E4A6_PAEPS|nr:Ger(x)C family spore germination C-terminal domain-containing protein [Paenibacillus polymyxa]ADO56646.1 spore gernimation protein [Paenibacillus polymyxa SC2]WPQ59272.1 Ger(x)C family spore germination C-terminal domain-containing protein [Paenibacillus polymyxa]CCC85348.1 putative spore germination protein YfkR [Paenibacillus polymyxa M1]